MNYKMKLESMSKSEIGKCFNLSHNKNVDTNIRNIFLNSDEHFHKSHKHLIETAKQMDNIKQLIKSMIKYRISRIQKM